ncbi:MAG: amidohydrolase family protein [Litorilinea sp.]
MIIEWNAHMFHADTERYPFHPQAVYKPKPDARAADPLAEYLDHMTQHGIDRAVLVHPEPYGDDHRLVLEYLAREPEKFRGTSLFYPKDPEAPAKLAALVAQEPKIVSTRFHALHNKDQYLTSFDDAGVRAIWDAAAQHNLIVELHIGPDFAAQAAKRIAEYPNTPVLIDHLAEPHTASAVDFAQVLELAQYDNVYMKLSGLNHFAKDAPLYTSAKPFTRLVAQAFGPNRMVWGSGTPDIVDAHLDFWSDAERARVKGLNLQALLGF